MSRGTNHRILPNLLRIGAPALAALALVVVISGDVVDLDHDLQLIAPASASPGDTLPVRALVFSGLRSVEGPQLSAHDVDLELTTGDRASENVVARARLHRSRAGTNDVEGALSVPQDARGRVHVRARVRLGHDELQVTSPVSIDPAARGVAIEERPLRLLQQFSESAIQRAPFGPPPSALEVRVRGGACVPEQPCAIFVHIGEPGAALQLEPNDSFSFQTPQASPKPGEPPPVETDGIVELDIITHGPEATLWLRATHAGGVIGRRSVRLPIVQASAALSVREALLDAPASPILTLAGEPEGCIVDAHRLDASARTHWVRTGSSADCSQPTAAPFAALPQGAYRLQARHDPFATTSAAARVIYVRARGETNAEVVSALATAAHAVDPQDAFAARALAHPEALDAASVTLALGYLAAILENGIAPQPPAANGYAEAAAKLAAARAKLRWLALVALALGGTALALGVGQRGLLASARASQILVEAGQDAPAAQRTRMRTTVATIASALALLLVFVVVALYVVARGSR